jgi:murein L,D-transpeptidase YcbB/YkuD
VTIPTLPANPTPVQIQSAISAILNNIAYLQAQLQILQGVQPFTQDLFYGLWNNAEVKRLQEFLISKGYLTGTATGNYYTKTVAAVKAYQAAKGITPVSGYFGPKTRTAVNSDLGL